MWRWSRRQTAELRKRKQRGRANPRARGEDARWGREGEPRAHLVTSGLALPLRARGLGCLITMATAGPVCSAGQWQGQGGRDRVRAANLKEVQT